MSEIKLTINNNIISTIENKTILEVCKENGIDIPTLCYYPDLKPAGSCGMCVVEVCGEKDLVKACETKVCDGMIINTESGKVIDSRKKSLNNILSKHPNDCLTCEKSAGNCELQNIADYYEINPKERKVKNRGLDMSSPAIIRDMDKCIACERCVNVCKEIQGIGIYEKVETEDDVYITTKKNIDISESECIYCGQCVKVCPVAALTEKNEIYKVMDALRDPGKHVVVQMAPAIQNTLGEEFGLAPGTDVTLKIPTALKMLGADKVFHTDFSADLTIMEEGTEFLNRMKKGENLPLMTSCCPGWIRYIEFNYPKLLKNVSSCKSPQQMFGAIVKSYYAEKCGIKPEDIFHVSIMPCTAKKFEKDRPEMSQNGIQDVDAVLTTREFAKLLKIENINLLELKDESFDKLLGEGTGAARIFATTGGVMEAALRTVAWILTDGNIDTLEYKDLRGFEGVKEAQLDINGQKIKVAVVNGIANVKKILDKIAAGEIDYQFIEVMACPGGCISGGGAPILGSIKASKSRMEGIYNSDNNNPIRRSHENVEVQKLYKDYLTEPGSDKSHKLLHTKYVNRS